MDDFQYDHDADAELIIRSWEMKVSELRAKDAAGLQAELESLLKAQFNLRMQRATQQLSNTSQLGKVRRDIARVRTIMTENAGK